MQRTDAWFKARAGKFTASTIHNILGKEGLKRTKDAIKTTAFNKAVETVFGVDPEERYISKDMERGIIQEPLAFHVFKEIKNLEFIDVKEVGFYKYGKHAGASPDGLVSDNAVLEIKCPRRDKFFRLVSDGLEAVDDVYISQMHLQMMSTKTDKAYFFNYYLENAIQYWHEIVIHRDEEKVKLIDSRIKEATEVKLDFIEKIKKNQQW